MGAKNATGVPLTDGVEGESKPDRAVEMNRNSGLKRCIFRHSYLGGFCK